MTEELTSPLKKHKRSGLQVVLTAGFFLAVSNAFIVYINSSYLSTLIDESLVGYLYSFTCLVAAFIMQYYGRLIAKYTNRIVFLVALALTTVSLVVMWLNPSVLLSLIAFTIYNAIGYLVIINFDILLEHISEDRDTGRIRGAFLTTLSLGFVITPIVSGAIVNSLGSNIAYAISAVLSGLLFTLVYVKYRPKKKFKYQKHKPFKRVIKRITHDKNLRGIFMVALILQIFYAWMVIYTPIHLLQIGFDWSEIGLMFTIMLIPFVLLQFPAGYIADKYIGEVEMLTVGIACMAIAAYLLTTATTFVAVAAVLFLSRVGASLVEVMRDTYFYKKVDADELDIIEEFRMTGPVAYIIAPTLASIILGAGANIEMLFIVLSIFLVVSTLVPLTIEDTK